MRRYEKGKQGEKDYHSTNMQSSEMIRTTWHRTEDSFLYNSSRIISSVPSRIILLTHSLIPQSSMWIRGTYIISRDSAFSR